MKICNRARNIFALSAFTITAACLLGALLPLSEADAAWNSVAGIKDGNDTVNELANPWDGERLLVFGGGLNFAGNANVDGEIWIQAMSGWSTPAVNIAGALTKTGNGQFTVTTPNFTIGNAAASSVEAGTINLGAGQLITLGSVTAHDNVDIRHAGTKLRVLNDYVQDGGAFWLLFDGAFEVDGAFIKSGNGDFSIGTPNFTIGDAAASSVEAGRINMGAGQLITLGSVTAHDNVDIRHAGTKLHVLEDYVQDGGAFWLLFDGAFEVDGAFIKTGNGDFNIGTPNFKIGDAARSSVEAGRINVSAGTFGLDGPPITLGSVTAHDDVDIRHVGTKLHVLEDYVQDGGSFAVIFQGAFEVDGAFTKTGSGDFIVSSDNSKFRANGAFTIAGSGNFTVNSIGAEFSIANPTASSIEAGAITVRDSQVLTINEITAHGNFEAGNLATVHVLSDFVQDGGNFLVDGNSIFNVDGTFTKTGNGQFVVAWSNTDFSIGNPAASSIEAGVVSIRDGNDVVVNQMTVHDNFELRHSASLHLLTDYQQDGGGFVVDGNSTFSVDGAFTKTGNGQFVVAWSETDFSTGNPAASSIEAGIVSIRDGNDVVVNQMTVHDNFELRHSASLHLLTDYQQDGGDFVVQENSTFEVDGAFIKTGNGQFVVAWSETDFSIGNPATSSIEAGIVSIRDGNDVVVNQMTVHDNFELRHSASLHLLTDYQQDGGGFSVQENSTFGVDGAFNKTGNGDFSVSNDTIFRVGGQLSIVGNGVFGISGANSSFQLDNPLESSVEAGVVRIEAGAQVTIGNMLAHGNVRVGDGPAGSKLHLLGDYEQDNGSFEVFNSAQFIVNGTFTNTSAGAVNIHNATFTSGDAEVNTIWLASGTNATTNDLAIHGTTYIEHANTSLVVQGNFSQDSSNFLMLNNSTMQVNGGFSYTAGNRLEVSNNAVLTTTGANSGASVSNDVAIFSGGKATIGQLTAHGNVAVHDATSVLRVRGDYLQDAGGLSINNGGTLNVEGSFRYTIGGPSFINFGNGFLRVGDTLTIEDNHYWNLTASGGKIRVGDGTSAPAAGIAFVSTNGTLTGGGTIIGALANNGGTVAPGNSVGRLDVTGNYSQTAGSILEIEIGGPLADSQYDQLFISGTASLLGTLAVELVDLGSGMFAPSLGQTFDILKAGSERTGTFNSVSLPHLPGNLDWQVTYLANFVRLEVIQGAAFPGDFNDDGAVNTADYVLWRKTGGTPVQYTEWRTNFGLSQNAGSGGTAGVPEPAGILQLFAGLACSAILAFRPRR